MKLYMKKPIPVEAIQWTGESDNNWSIAIWANNAVTGIFTFHGRDNSIEIKTLEGTMRPNKMDYIVKGPAGEFWFVKKEIFEATYEEIK